MKSSGKRLPLSVLTLAVLLSLSGCSSAAVATASAQASETRRPVPTLAPEEYTAELFFTGDFLIHGAVYADAVQADGSYDFTGMLAELKELSAGYDLKYYNQETILGGTELGLSSYPQFNSPQEAGDAMVAAGFNLVSTATNHSLDMGVTGIERSVAYWQEQEEAYGVHMAGTYLSWEEQQAIPVYEVNGITYTFLSWTYGCNGLTAPAGEEYLVNVYAGRQEELLEQIRQADALSDFVIVAMHWGTEYSMAVNEEQQTLAQEMAAAGADVIIGNHPHVIEPVQRIGDAVCWYAMGNMLSAQNNQENLIGMVGAVTLHKTALGSEVTTSVENPRADLIYTYYEPGYVNFRVIPFDRLDDSLLPGCQQLETSYDQVITSLDDSVVIGGIRLEGENE